MSPLRFRLEQSLLACWLSVCGLLHATRILVGGRR